MKKYIVFSVACLLISGGFYMQTSISLQDEIGIPLNDSQEINQGEPIDQGESQKIVYHLEKPPHVKSLYYNASASSRVDKREELMNLVDTKEINSVTIDIKTVSGYVSFDMPEEYFGDIKPVSNGVIDDIELFIETLHEKGVYVIGRVVVFKDKALAESRSDLAIKWGDQSDVWSDYKGNKYLDPASIEVRDYNANIANAAYKIGFDEINFDYVRFPTDGYISDTYYPFAEEILASGGKWGKIKVIDNFAYHITSKLKEKHPDIILSADVFGLVTNSNGYQIGQNLESFLINFDYVGPMIYPSHYGAGFLGYTQPDNQPYEIFTYALEGVQKKIDDLNQNIELTKSSTGAFVVGYAYTPSRPLNEIPDIHISQVRPWIQGFSCSWCTGATPYNRTKFRKQISAIEDAGGNSWWVWSASSSYYEERYDDKEIETISVINKDIP